MEIATPELTLFALAGATVFQSLGRGSHRFGSASSFAKFRAAFCITAGASGCTIGPLLIFYGILMALPGLQEIENERDFPGFLRQVGISLLLAVATLAHAGWLQADSAQLPAVIEAMLASMLGVGLFSALLIRLAVIAASRKS